MGDSLSDGDDVSSDENEQRADHDDDKKRKRISMVRKQLFESLKCVLWVLL